MDSEYVHHCVGSHLQYFKLVFKGNNCRCDLMVSAEEEASAGIVRVDIWVYWAAQTHGLAVAVHTGQGAALVVQKLLSIQGFTRKMLI